MKQFFLFIIILNMECTLSVYGQGTMPAWIQKPPAKTATYYYRVSQATGLTEEAATKKAFAMAILESAFAIGIPVDLQKMEKLESNELLIEANRYVKIPINKVCQHVMELTTKRGYRVYILCQVANNVHEIPAFKTFNCTLNKEEE